MQDDGPALRVLDHEALRTAETEALGGGLGGECARGEGGKGLEVGLRRGRGDERGEGDVGEVEGECGVLRGETGHDGGGLLAAVSRVRMRRLVQAGGVRRVEEQKRGFVRGNWRREGGVDGVVAVEIAVVVVVVVAVTVSGGGGWTDSIISR